MKYLNAILATILLAATVSTGAWIVLSPSRAGSQPTPLIPPDAKYVKPPKADPEPPEPLKVAPSPSDKVKLPSGLAIGGETKIAPYRLVELTPLNADTDAAVLWDVFPEDAVDSRERDGVLLFTAPPGTYRIKLRTIRGKVVQLARAEVTIGTPGPPAPPVPPPSDPFVQALQTAYSADADPGKAGKLAQLIALYEVAATKTVDDKALNTNAELANKIHNAVVTVLENGLSKVRRAIADELDKDLDRVSTDPINRASWRAALTKVGAALQGVK